MLRGIVDVSRSREVMGKIARGEIVEVFMC